MNFDTSQTPSVQKDPQRPASGRRRLWLFSAALAISSLAFGVFWLGGLKLDVSASAAARAEVAVPPVKIPGPSTAPAQTASATLGALDGNWPAYRGGGELRGVAKAIGDKPLVQRWRFKPEEEPSPIEGSAAIVGDSAYIGDTKGRLLRLDLANGKPRWQYLVDAGFAASPLVMGGKVYVGDQEGVFHCVDAETGKEIWKFDADNGQPIHAAANAVGDKLIYGDDGSDVICLDISGKKIWQVTTGDRVNSAPAIGNGLAYVSGCDAKLHGINVADGVEKFALDLPGLAPGSPALLPDRLVIGTDGGNVVAVQPDGSKMLWTYSDVKNSAMVYSSPAVAEGIVVVGARDRHVHAIDAADGKRKWTFATRGDVDSSPVIAGDRVYVGSRDKKLYVLDLKTGKQLGDFQCSRAIDAAPAIGQGVVVIGDSSGAIYCLEPK